MSVIVITGAAGLIGSEAVKFFSEKGYTVVGIDNDLRKYFFGEEASTKWVLAELQRTCKNFSNYAVDIRDAEALTRIFQRYAADVTLIIHTASQPSHDWAATEP